MSNNSNRAAMRLALLAIGIVGLAISVALCFYYTATKKANDVEKVTVVVKETKAGEDTKIDVVDEKPGTEATIVSIEEVKEKEAAGQIVQKVATKPVPPPAPKLPLQTHIPAPPQETAKLHHIAEAEALHHEFPPPQGLSAAPQRDLKTPTSGVEMWAGDRRTVVVVPRGSKFE